MVSLNKKMVFKIAITVILLTVCATAFICRRITKRQESECGICGSRQNGTNAVAEIDVRMETRGGVHVYGDELQRLRSVWIAASDDLANGNINGMKVKSDSVFDKTMNLSTRQFCDVVAPFTKRLRSAFCGKEVENTFTDADEFRRHMMANLKGMNIIGELELRVYMMQSPLEFREGDALLTLNAYKSHFERLGRLDLALCADAMVESLTRQIESENGLTYRYMRQLLEVNKKLMVDRGVATREEVLRGIRTRAHWLQAVGCTPKWLSEFGDCVKP